MKRYPCVSIYLAKERERERGRLRATRRFQRFNPATLYALPIRRRDARAFSVVILKAALELNPPVNFCIPVIGGCSQATAGCFVLSKAPSTSI